MLEALSISQSFSRAWIHCSASGAQDQQQMGRSRGGVLWPVEVLKHEWVSGGPCSPRQQVPQKQNHLKHHWGQLRPLWPAPNRPGGFCCGNPQPAMATAGWRCSEMLRARDEEVTLGRWPLQVFCWPPHLGFVPLFFCFQLSLFPEWRQAGRLDCPEALPTSWRRQGLGKHPVSPLWERRA